MSQLDSQLALARETLPNLRATHRQTLTNEPEQRFIFLSRPSLTSCIDHVPANWCSSGQAGQARFVGTAQLIGPNILGCNDDNWRRHDHKSHGSEQDDQRLLQMFERASELVFLNRDQEEFTLVAQSG